MVQKRCFSAKSRDSSLLRKRKYQLIRRLGLQDFENALGGHLAMTYRRCGKPTCHCATGRGHPQWTLSYSFEGEKKTETVPPDLARELVPLVGQGRQVREAVMEVLAINLQLLRLWREQERARQSKREKPRAGKKPKRRRPVRNKK